MQPLLNLNILQKPLLYAFDAASLLALAYLIAGPLRLTRAAPPSAPAVHPGSPGRPRSHGGAVSCLSRWLPWPAER